MQHVRFPKKKKEKIASEHSTGSCLHFRDPLASPNSDIYVASKPLGPAPDIHYIWSAPLESLAIAALLIYRVRVAALPGIALLVLIVPLQYWFASRLAHYRSKGMSVTSVRVRVMNEVLLAIKMVKFYAWERRFANEVTALRAKELRILRKAAGIKTFNLLIVFIIPPLMALAIYGSYIKLTGPLTPAVAFVVISLFNTLRFPLVVLPRALRGTAESFAAVDTIQKFLLLEEHSVQKKKRRPGVKFENASFGFRAPVVHNLSFDLPKGKLMGIAGPVGSGKSSIISAILGETNIFNGSYQVGGRIALVPQTPWVQCATVRENVRPFFNFFETQQKKPKFLVFRCLGRAVCLCVFLHGRGSQSRTFQTLTIDLHIFNCLGSMTDSFWSTMGRGALPKSHLCLCFGARP